MEASCVAHGRSASAPHLRRSPHRLDPGVDKPTIPHRPDVPGNSRRCDVQDLVVLGSFRCLPR